MLTPYQFAGNKPIAAIDLDGLEEQIKMVAENNNNKPKIEITTKPTESMVTAFDVITSLGEEIINQYPTTPSLSQKIANLGKFSTMIQGIELHDKSGKLSSKKEILNFKQEVTSWVLTEIVAFYSPFLSVAVGGILDNSRKDDGLFF